MMQLALLFLCALGSGLDVGEVPPDFSLNDETGNIVQFSTLLGNGPIVVFFYGKDKSSKSIKELKAFQRKMKRFEKYHAQVFGINQDSQATHESTAIKYNLTFSLLSDPKKKVRKSWDVSTFLFMQPRVTHVFNSNGTLIWKYNSHFTISGHARKAARIVRLSQAPIALNDPDKSQTLTQDPDIIPDVDEDLYENLFDEIDALDDSSLFSETSENDEEDAENRVLSFLSRVGLVEEEEDALLPPRTAASPSVNQIAMPKSLNPAPLYLTDMELPYLFSV